MVSDRRSVSRKEPRVLRLFASLFTLKASSRSLFQVQFIDSPVPLIKVILYGTSFLIIGFCIILTTSIFLAGNTYALPRLVGIVPVLGYITVIGLLYRRRTYGVVAWLLVGFYGLLGFITLLLWGINAPVGLLILSFAILLSGVIRGARSIVPTTLVVCLIVVFLHFLAATGIIHPDQSMLDEVSTYVDVTTYVVVFTVIATVSWLYGRRMEQALARAVVAESGLQKEKNLLAERLEQKTREVREAQLEEMRGLYRFAELGQLSTVLLHDLANNLTALTLDIDDIERRNRRSLSITRARESISYLENVIKGVRTQINIESKPRVFDVIRTIFDCITELDYKARRAGVLLQYEHYKKAEFLIKGDPSRLSHVLTIIISNAIESYVDTKNYKDKPVVVTVTEKSRGLVIMITDYGAGITAAHRKRLFQPFITTKPSGMGIGLFMAKTMVEQHFGGTLVLEPDDTATTFTLILPKAHSDKIKKI